LVNAFGGCKIECPNNFNVYQWDRLRASEGFSETLLNPEYHKLYWEKQHFEKPYWLGHYLLTGSLYDPEFERDYEYQKMKTHLVGGLNENSN
jgi:hypothetical protein